MKLGKKRVTIITSIISIALLAGYLGLRAAEVIGEDRTWLPLLIVSWLLILRDYSSLAANGEELKIAGLPDWQKHSVGDDRSGFAVILPVEKPPVEVPVVELFLRR